MHVCLNVVKLNKMKVKCTLVQVLRLCTGFMANGGSRGIVLLFLDHGTRRGEKSGSCHSRFYPPGKNQYPLYRTLGGPQDQSGQVQKILPPDHPALSQSLHQQRYLAHVMLNAEAIFCFLKCIFS